MGLSLLDSSTLFGDSLFAHLDLVVDGKEERVRFGVALEDVISEFVTESSARGEVLLDNVNKLFCAEFLLIENVTLLEKVNHFSDFKSNILFCAKKTGSSSGFTSFGLLLGTEVRKDNAKLLVVLCEDALTDFEVFVILSSLGLVLSGQRHKLVFEQILKLVRKSGQIRVICVLNSGGTDQCLKELTLQDNLGGVVNIFSLHIIILTLVVVFILFREVRVIVLLGGGCVFSTCFVTVHEIEFVNFSGSK